MTRFGFRINDELYQRAKARAAATGRSLNAWLIQIVTRELENPTLDQTKEQP